ncbi:MAG: hypothetical protein JWL83_12 [Actinomycetia bacterium]|nr:hypothetical protein [Actinomycetes bacterium]
MAARVHVSPEQFTLIPYDANEIASIAEDVAALIGFPPNVDIEIEVDEELFAPLTGHMSDVIDGAARIWISGANFEDKKAPQHFSPEQARDDLIVALLRAKDRLSDGFDGASSDADITRAERAAWDASVNGRARELGVRVREQALRYEFRLQHGFTDVGDAAFDRLFAADSVTWEGLREICRETGAVDRPASKVPVDLLRQK